MQTTYRHFLIQAGPVLDVAHSFRSERIRVMEATWDYVSSIGATGYQMGWHRLHAVRFNGPAPEGFCKPNKYGCVTPKKKTKWAEEFAALPKLPACHTQLAALIGFVGCVSYESEESSGSRSTGCFEPLGISGSIMKARYFCGLPVFGQSCGISPRSQVWSSRTQKLEIHARSMA